MQLTAEQRMEFVSSVWANFVYCHLDHERQISHAEYDLARRWALRGVPLATVLQGITETTGTVRRLGACERAVEASISRWAAAMGGLTELPPAGPLEDPA